MSVKIDLNSGKIIQQIALELKKKPVEEINKFKLEYISDVKKISEDSKNLRNVDPVKSSIEITSTQINFNLIYLAVPLTAFEAGGFINKEDKTIEIDFSYEFPREIAENGNSVCKQFLFTMNIKARYEESPSHSEKILAEDILKFIQRVVNGIFDRFNDGKKSLKTIAIDQKNVEKMINLDSGEISGMVQTLVGAVISFAKFKELNETNNLKAGVVLRHPGGKNILNDFSVKKVISYNAEIKELETDAGRNLNTIFL